MTFFIGRLHKEIVFLPHIYDLYNCNEGIMNICFIIRFIVKVYNQYACISP